MEMIYSPNNWTKGWGDQRNRIFLSGSIDMGKAPDWQADLAEKCKDLDVVFLNPRRKDWDSTWEPKITNPKFKEQVEWELTGLERANLVVMYMHPETMAPVTLLELGLMVERSANIVVCCPEGYWRKGNVDVVCERYGLDQVPTLEALAEYIEEWDS